jgi:glycopeptide antibiotics resistance protein
MRGLHVTFFGPLGLLVVAAGALSAAVAARRRDPAADSRPALRIAIFASLAAIFSLTLVPTGGPNELQLVPLVHIVRGLRFHDQSSDVPFNVVGNIVLFLPFGAALCLLGLRRGRAVLAGFCLSAAIETAQLFIPGRTTSSDDVLLNTLGTFLGYVLLTRKLSPPEPPT